jgi:hypothetical protein
LIALYKGVTKQRSTITQVLKFSSYVITAKEAYSMYCDFVVERAKRYG